MVTRLSVAMLVALLAIVTACRTDQGTTDTAAMPEATGDVFVTAEGQHIEIVNPSEDTVRLLGWAFGRFLQAGLKEPDIERVHFGDKTPGCLSRSGWAKETERGAEIAVCIADDRICSEGLGSPLTNPAKFCVLHELAHGWLFDYLPEEVKSTFLDHVGLVEWATTEETPWHQRGVEYAAEVMAWGLMDRPLNLIRIESPDCGHLEAGFRILTEAAPIVRCDSNR